MNARFMCKMKNWRARRKKEEIMDRNWIEKILEIAAHLAVGAVIVISVLTGQ